MKRIHLIKQHDEKDCGAACLSMILDYHGRKLPMAAVREAIQVDQYGASVYGMLDGAEQNGLSAQAFQGEAHAAWQAMSCGFAPLPAIIRVVNHKMLEHYVVVTGIRNGKLHILDPDLGRGQMPREAFEECFLGELLIFEKTDAFRPENLRKGHLRRFTGMIFRQKRLLAGIGLLSLLVTGIGLAGTFLFQFLFDNVLADLNDHTALEEGMHTLSILILGLAVIYLIKLAVELLRGKLLTTMSRNIDLPLMLGCHDHMTSLPMNFFDTRKTGEIISRFGDAGKIREAISGATLTLMIDVAMAVVTAVVLYRASTALFTIAAVISVLCLLVSLLYLKPLDKFNRELMAQDEQFNSYLKETVDGMETVKTSQAEATVKSKTGDMFRRFLDRSIRGSLLALSKDAIISCITSIGMLALLWVGAVDIVNGRMTIGSLVTFVSLLDYFLTPVQSLLGLQDDLQTALVAADRLSDVLDLHAERTGGQTPAEPLNSISFDNVSFRYGTRQLVLDGLSFSAEAGQQVALVGESGCGKSTAAKLLQGLYQKESGEVRINGTPIEDLSLAWLRSQTACVPQTTFLFSDTVRNNLLLGLDPDRYPSDREIWQVLDACCCQFVRAMPLELDSMLEENGVNLSGGQRQRLAIARALLRKPRLLILDEATSALDTRTESQVLQALRSLCPDMIVLTIAHRLSTVKHCDKIIVIASGQAVETGAHPELLLKNRIYADLWRRQNDTESLPSPALYS